MQPQTHGAVPRLRVCPRLVGLALCLGLLTSSCTAPVASVPKRALSKLLLPTLVVLPSPGIYLGTPKTAFVDSAGEMVTGCTRYEVTYEHAQRCLRFDTIVGNLGAGPLEIRVNLADVLAARAAGRPYQATQRVYRAGGGYFDRMAGRVYINPYNDRIVYAVFGKSALWRATPQGRRLGRHPIRTGVKDAFCLGDDMHIQDGPSSPTRPRYQATSACYPVPIGMVHAGSQQVNGISVGWADVYDMSLTNQMIEVNGLPDGFYLLEIIVDPLHTLLVGARSTATSWQLVEICGAVAVLPRQGQHCPAAQSSSTSPTAHGRVGGDSMARHAASW